MSATARLALPLVAAAQAQKHVTVNDALATLDALVQISAKSRTVAAPPGTPAAGDRYVVAASPTGAWVGKAGKLAEWLDGAWTFRDPRTGWLIWIEDEQKLAVQNGTGLVDQPSIGSLSNVPLLGVATTADATNPLAVRGPNLLFAGKSVASGGSGDVRVKLVKEASTNTASLVWQSNWSGRAEFGLAGNDDLSLKVSPDGSAWTDAMKIDRATGVASFPAGIDSAPRIVERDLRLMALIAAETKGARVDTTSGMADAFVTQAAVDLATSTNQSWISASQWYVASGGTAMSLRSIGFTASITPSRATLAIQASSASAIALDTDLKGHVSRDGGTTWTQVPLAWAGTREDGSRVADGEVALGTQPAGTSLRWRIDAAPGVKAMGVVLQWRA